MLAVLEVGRGRRARVTVCAMWSNWTLGELEKRIDWTFDYVEAGVQWETPEMAKARARTPDGPGNDYTEMFLRLPLLWEMLDDAPFAAVIANSFREVQTFCEDVVKCRQREASLADDVSVSRDGSEPQPTPSQVTATDLAPNTDWREVWKDISDPHNKPYGAGALGGRNPGGTYWPGEQTRLFRLVGANLGAIVGMTRARAKLFHVRAIPEKVIGVTHAHFISQWLRCIRPLLKLALGKAFAIEYLLQRYQFRCETFERERLRDLANIGKQPEAALALDLQRYLFDSGVASVAEAQIEHVRPDALVLESQLPLYVEAKQYKKAPSRKEVLDWLAQMRDTYPKCKSQMRQLTDAVLVIYVRDDAPIELRNVADLGFTLHTLTVNISDHTGSKAKPPKVIDLQHEEPRAETRAETRAESGGGGPSRGGASSRPASSAGKPAQARSVDRPGPPATALPGPAKRRRR